MQNSARSSKFVSYQAEICKDNRGTRLLGVDAEDGDEGAGKMSASQWPSTMPPPLGAGV